MVLITRLKSQVKTRMSVLLSEEEQSTTATRSVGMSSTGAGLVTEGRGGGGNNRQSVAAEADVLFTASTGLFVCVVFVYKKNIVWLKIKGMKIFRVSSTGMVSKCTSADSISVFKYRNKIPGTCTLCPDSISLILLLHS